MFLTLAVAALLPTVAVNDPNSPAAPAVSAAPAAPAPVAVRPVVYCIKDTLPASRIERKFCKSREAWLGSGIDPLEAKRP